MVISATARNAAIRPYSIAVAARSSRRKFVHPARMFMASSSASPASAAGPSGSLPNLDEDFEANLNVETKSPPHPGFLVVRVNKSLARRSTPA